MSNRVSYTIYALAAGLAAIIAGHLAAAVGAPSTIQYVIALLGAAIIGQWAVDREMRRIEESRPTLAEVGSEIRLDDLKPDAWVTPRDAHFLSTRIHSFIVASSDPDSECTVPVYIGAAPVNGGER